MAEAINTIHMRVVVFCEEGVWVAQALEHDIGAQAKDHYLLKARFHLTVTEELAVSLERSNTPFGGIEPAPERFQKMWSENRPCFFSGWLKFYSTDIAAVNYTMQLVS